MRPLQGIVTTLPLPDLWNTHGPHALNKQWDVGYEEIVPLLRLGLVKFVIAEGGHPPDSIPAENRYQFRKDIVKPHLVELDARETGFNLNDYRDALCFLGSLRFH